MPSPHQPDVSVVLPTWNGAKYLSQSIESVLHQEGVTKELIVVDDASYDYTPGICARYVEEYPDIIRYFRNETQQKLPTCLNIGFSRANGKAWTWTSDDNYYRNNALNTMYKALLSTKSDVVYAGVTDINEESFEAFSHWCLVGCALVREGWTKRANECPSQKRRPRHRGYRKWSR